MTETLAYDFVLILTPPIMCRGKGDAYEACMVERDKKARGMNWPFSMAPIRLLGAARLRRPPTGDNVTPVGQGHYAPWNAANADCWNITRQHPTA
ncbi:hypothetical protein PQR02_34685 [Paraburkholderia sediminicola]|uniref:Uncharacterized protein n=1 Tax=Paraburkholderia rhynchosiae TaxID=487049 RepID=A0ACC7NLS8_9BURK